MQRDPISLQVAQLGILFQTAFMSLMVAGTLLRHSFDEVKYVNERLLTYSFLHFYSFISAVLPEFDLIPKAQESADYSPSKFHPK